ncbi:hypothetical protein BsWGS_10474 [Bradybaena similaris]
MSSSHKHTLKTGIPVFKMTLRRGDGDVLSARSQQTLVESQQQSRSTSRASARSQSSSSSSSSQRLEKRQDVVNPTTHAKLKMTKNNNQCPETWADEVIQSQSQKLRNSSQSDSRKRWNDMEKHLHEAEAQLATMGKLLEKREKLMNEAAEEAAKKTAELEKKLINQEGHLIKHDIDPVTGTQITLDEEGEKKVEDTRKFTKKRVQEMKAKLHQMNSQAESYLSDIENTLQFLNDLEAAVNRAGQPSDSILQRFDDDYEVDKQQPDQSLHQQAGSGRNSALRSVLSEKMPQFGNCNINFSVNDVDGDNDKCLYLEGQCDKLGNVDMVDAESAVEEKIP